nr:MAG TPA: hypothetical protein [Bacteriophage sp.]
MGYFCIKFLYFSILCSNSRRNSFNFFFGLCYFSPLIL